MSNAMHPAVPYRIVMCAPEHFEVSYAINPWMQPGQWAEQRGELTGRSNSGWRDLTGVLKDLEVQIELVPPVPGLPDMVFTANAAVVLDGKALVATFRHPQRQGETAHFRRWFDAAQQRGLVQQVHDMPDGLVLEGAGDCVWDEVRGRFWLGYGQRSDAAAADVVRRLFGREVIALPLVDPRFYHMDTALVPLSGGEALYFPGAFSDEGNRLIEEKFGRDKLLPVPLADACTLAVNAVNLGRDIVLAVASPALKAMLTQRGYRVHEVPIQDFGLSGGSAFCLTLRLDRRSPVKP